MSRITELLLVLLTTGVWASALRGSVAQDPRPGDGRSLALDELVVKRLRVVGEDGKDCVVLSNSARFPKPRLGGKEYPRSIAPSGMVFYRANGDECGGVVVVDSAQGTANMAILDYANNDAIGFGVQESPGGRYSAGLSISSRPPLDADPMKAASLARQRIAIRESEGLAQVVLFDPEGRQRMLLAVDRNGDPSLRILDVDGKVLFEAP